MRKIAFILALLMIFSVICLTSCTKETTYQIYKKAFDKTNALTDSDISMHMEGKLTESGTTNTIPADIKMKITKDDNGNPMVDAIVTMSNMGADFTSRNIFIDGWVYTVITSNVYNNKCKMQMTYEEATKVMHTEADMIEFEEDDFINLKFNEENGVKSLTFTLSRESIKEKLIESYGTTSVKEAESSDDVSVSDVNVTLGIDKDGYLYKYSIKFTMNFMSGVLGTDEKSEVTEEITIDLVYNNIGEPVTVTVPADADVYEDMTE